MPARKTARKAARKPARKPAARPSKPKANAKAKPAPPARPKAAKPAAASAQAPAAAARKAGGGGAAVRSITPFLWFDQEFEEAAQFYVSLFPDSRIESVHPMGGSFVLASQRFMGLNGGPDHRFSPAVSFFVVCRDQEEVDRLWAALEEGGRPSRCGWIDDRFGLTWQIVPEDFLRLTSDPDPKKVQAVFQAMMGMVKMDVAGLQLAYDTA